MNEARWIWITRVAMHLSVLGVFGACLQQFQGQVEWGSSWGWLGVLTLGFHLAKQWIPWRVLHPLKLQWSEATLVAPTTGGRGAWSTCLPAAAMELPLVLRTLAVACLTVALFRPQSASTVEDMTREGIDLIMAMDLSQSMLARDFEPNRLESAKEVAIDFVGSRPFDRIGVVAFEGEAFTQVPITTDHVVVKNGLAGLNTGLLEPGTAIGSGLAVAVNRLRSSEAKSKVVILLTDGENTAGQIEPIDAAQLAELNHIKVYTIGVGTIGKAKFPVTLTNGQTRMEWMDVRIDEATLKGIAEATGGRYFRATNDDKLQDIYREIDALETTQFNVLRYQRKTEAFGPWALASLLALLLEFALKTTALRTLEA